MGLIQIQESINEKHGEGAVAVRSIIKGGSRRESDPVFLLSAVRRYYCTVQYCSLALAVSRVRCHPTPYNKVISLTYYNKEDGEIGGNSPYLHLLHVPPSRGFGSLGLLGLSPAPFGGAFWSYVT
jgi:hypothetical protein